MSVSKVISISGKEHFEQILQTSKEKLVVCHFAASWAPQCSQISDVLQELAKSNDLRTVLFVEVNAESLQELAKQYKVASVPTCILFAHGKPCGVIEGANVMELTKKVRETAFKKFPLSVDSLPASEKHESLDLNERLKSLINKGKVMIFMKGSPDAPRCGFSRQLVDILNEADCKYESFDILSDEEVRQGLKVYSNWPTFPQIYVDGELVGGLDIIKDLREAGDLKETLKIA